MAKILDWLWFGDRWIVYRDTPKFFLSKYKVSTQHQIQRNLMQKQSMSLYPRAPIYFSLVFLVAIIGFYPSFFSNQTKTDATHHFHGFMATAWMLMLITQGWLMRQRKFSAHRALGRLSIFVAPLFIASGFLVIHAMLSSTTGFSQAFGARLAFVDITTIIYFAVAYSLAIYYRKNIQLHARYMASTAILVLPPALARALAGLVPGINSFEAAFYWSFAISVLVVIALIADDVRSGKIRPPYLVLLALLLLQTASFQFIPSIGWWKALSAGIGSL